ncbi:MAG: NAD-dependent epimerase/dehydratase family protein [Candidatus Omnitrophica bacterium]|nr:NAD-dependent epimerase/dehydratase family protein [Candidatus Omnitrophota bacterium]MBI3021898.1 NAD-dependent epimerase/dehydratase family protein [Candidatus Omnitrophota bacterium]
MRIFVTGATGFLGRALCAALDEQGHEVVGVSSRNCDLRQQGSLRRFNDRRYDQIYHLAAWTQAGDFCLSHPGEQWVVNQRMNTEVLAWWQRDQPQAKLIAIGASCGYDPRLPLIEAQYLRGEPIPGLLAYAMAKRMLYVGQRALHEQFGLSYLHVVPSTLYSPGYPRDGRQPHFIIDLIRKIIHGKVTGEPVVLWGDGYQRREVVYRDDVVRSLIALAEMCTDDLINVGAGEEFTIRQFAAWICDRVGYPVESIHFDTTRYVGATSKCLVIEKLKRQLPDMAWTPLDVGLGRTIEWEWEHCSATAAARKDSKPAVG